MTRSTPIRTYSTTPPTDEPQEQTKCIICNAHTVRRQWQLTHHTFVHCAECGHIYQNPRPTVTALDERYAEEYFQYEIENAEAFFQLMMRGIADSGIESMLQSTSPPHALLDIGCATGMLLQHYQQHGWETQGIELCRPAADYARETRGVPVMHGDYTKALLPAAHYAFVHSAHVIEHVPAPIHFLRFIHRVLHPDGYAIIVTPDAAGFQARLLRSRWRSVIADHLNLFRAHHLTALAQRAGLELVRKCSWGGLAAGIAPKPIKYIADRLAKKLNIGDVMLLLLRRTK